MATYAIGDVHGCFDTLRALLRRIGHDPRQDRLWMVGDLVNRGPKSLQVLRWAAEMGDGRLVSVLGNHDLHLLSRAEGLSRPKRKDTLAEVLDAPDRDELLAWLRSQPLIHREDGHVLVHAGLFPDWTPQRAEELARETEARLREKGEREGGRLLASIDVKADERWKEGLPARDRTRVALAGFARLRTLHPDGRMCAGFSGPPRDAPRGCLPWFAVPGRRSADATVIFGHWAALGLHLGKGLAGLDSGCVWGQTLTALRVDDGRVFQEPALEPRWSRRQGADREPV